MAIIGTERVGRVSVPIIGQRDGDHSVRARRGPIVIKQRAATSAASFKYDSNDRDDGSPEGDSFLNSDLSLASALAEMKEREYPGHPFEFEVNTAQGVVLISIPALMGPINRYVIHVRDLYGDPKLTRVKRACGELLERYGIARAGYSRDDFAAAVTARPVLFQRHQDVPD
jgi:hypothetical protein